MCIKANYTKKNQAGKVDVQCRGFVKRYRIFFPKDFLFPLVSLHLRKKERGNTYIHRYKKRGKVEKMRQLLSVKVSLKKKVLV